MIQTTFEIPPIEEKKTYLLLFGKEYECMKHWDNKFQFIFSPINRVFYVQRGIIKKY